MLAVYIPPWADRTTALGLLHDIIGKYGTTHPDAVFIVAGDFNHCSLRTVLPKYHQHLSFPTRISCDTIKGRSAEALVSVLNSETSSLRELHLTVKTLDLTGNKLEDSGVKRLCAVLENPHCKVETLRLWYCGVSDEGCAALSSALRSNPSHLRELELNNNNLGDSGVKRLCAGLENPHCKVETLGLCGCGVSDEGCAALSSALRSNPAHLRQLDLSKNNLGNSGVKRLCAVLENPHCKLETLGGMENFNPLIEVLRERNIDEARIARILEDKIDVSVILLMSDDNLAKYIPHYGDRLVVLAFCRKQQSTDGNTDRKSHDGNTDRKRHLLERLRSKLCNPNPYPIEIKKSKISQKFIGNTNAKKKERKVQLGWMMYNEKDKEFKQVRQSKGGGTRDEKVDRLTTVEELKVKAENLFFPDGKANLFKLKLNDVHCTVRDTSHRILDPECTVEDLYEATKVKLLRLYLFTKPKHMEHSYIVDEEEPEIEAVSSVLQDEKQQLITIEILEEGTFDLENEDPRELMNQQLQSIQDMEIDHWQGTPLEPHKASEQGDNIQELIESINANRSPTNVRQSTLPRSHQTSEQGGNIQELLGINAHRNPINVRQETLQGELLEGRTATHTAVQSM
ncbi:uncharacterized protein LOC132870292 [Neoarius graeffei]|uniref:uncharacterized protein LOC132870292 n=1 Tax=Neoarius graeffei TaxID=443677 RepID=UPI00298D4582|nr:uncharacterized protein LOC132870292 [Neoarius graeffei]